MMMMMMTQSNSYKLYVHRLSVSSCNNNSSTTITPPTPPPSLLLLVLLQSVMTTTTMLMTLCAVTSVNSHLGGLVSLCLHPVHHVTCHQTIHTRHIDVASLYTQTHTRTQRHTHIQTHRHMHTQAQTDSNSSNCRPVPVWL